MKPLAIMAVYNEEDILPWTLGHLKEQGCDVYILDNWSTDSSAKIASRFGCQYELWPAERPKYFELAKILQRVEQIAVMLPWRWCMTYDADEIRRSPWPALSLAAGLQAANDAGFNAVQFSTFTFEPIDNGYTGDPERYFTRWDPNHMDRRCHHVKAWFQGTQRVNLHTSGGHLADFPGRMIHPIPFILKHYPVRSQQHGERKILQERLPRYSPQERAIPWHVQYDKVPRETSPNFLRDPKDLVEWVDMVHQ